MTKEDILRKFKDINFVYDDCYAFYNLRKMLFELERTVVIDGIEYVAESPAVKTISKDGEVVISGFREVKNDG
jgi:hypothetical protein